MNSQKEQNQTGKKNKKKKEIISLTSQKKMLIIDKLPKNQHMLINIKMVLTYQNEEK